MITFVCFYFGVHTQQCSGYSAILPSCTLGSSLSTYVMPIIKPVLAMCKARNLFSAVPLALLKNFVGSKPDCEEQRRDYNPLEFFTFSQYNRD